MRYGQADIMKEVSDRRADLGYFNVLCLGILLYVNNTNSATNI